MYCGTVPNVLWPNVCRNKVEISPLSDILSQKGVSFFVELFACVFVCHKIHNQIKLGKRQDNNIISLFIGQSQMYQVQYTADCRKENKVSLVSGTKIKCTLIYFT